MNQVKIQVAIHLLIVARSQSQVVSQVQNPAVSQLRFQIQIGSHSPIQYLILVRLVSRLPSQTQHLILIKIRNQIRIANQHLTQTVIRPQFQIQIENQAQSQAQTHSHKVKKYHSQNHCQLQLANHFLTQTVILYRTQ